MVEGPDVVDRATSTQKKPLGCMLRINAPPISARSVHAGPIKSENHHTSGTQPSPSPKSPKPASRGKSRRREAKVVRIRHRTEDSSATGDGSVIAYDPVSLAL